MILCKIGFHKYSLTGKELYCRCDNCEALSISAFPEGIEKYQCQCGNIKYKNNICEICGHQQKL